VGGPAEEIVTQKISQIKQNTAAKMQMACHQCNTQCTPQWRFGVGKHRLCNSCWAAEKRGGRKYNSGLHIVFGGVKRRKPKPAEDVDVDVDVDVEQTTTPPKGKAPAPTVNKQKRQRQRRKSKSLVVYLNGPAVQSVRSPDWIVQVASAFANKFWGRTEMFDPFPFDHNPDTFDCLTNTEWHRKGLKHKTFAYCNPPYAQLQLFLARMVRMWKDEGIPSVALIPHRIHRRYLSIHYGTFPIIPVNGGIRFLDSEFKQYPGILPEGLCLVMIGPVSSPMFGVVWRPCDTNFNSTEYGIEWKT
jgi:hypothetical protein